MRRSEARAVLGLPAVYSEAELDVAFRRQAWLTHPDRGGEPDGFAAVVEAHQLLTETRPTPANVVFADNRGRLSRLISKLHWH